MPLSTSRTGSQHLWRWEPVPSRWGTLRAGVVSRKNRPRRDQGGLGLVSAPRQALKSKRSYDLWSYHWREVALPSHTHHQKGHSEEAPRTSKASSPPAVLLGPPQLRPRVGTSYTRPTVNSPHYWLSSDHKCGHPKDSKQQRQQTTHSEGFISPPNTQQLWLHATNLGNFFSFLFCYKYFLIFLVMVS